MHNPVHVQLFVNSPRGHLSIIKPDRNRGRNPVFDQNCDLGFVELEISTYPS